MNNAIKWAGIMAIALILLGLVYYLTGMTDPETGESGWLNGLLSYVISVGAIVMGIKAFKNQNEGYLSVGQGVQQGLLIGLFAGLLMAIWTFMFFSFIEPDMMDMMKENALSQSGDVNEDQEEMMTGIFGAIFNPMTMAIMVIIMKVFLGLFVGLITGLIIKSNRPVEFLDS